MSKRQFALIGFFLVYTILTQTGCASFGRNLKSWLGGNPAPEQNKQATTLTKFSESPEVAPPVKRQYKRATRESLSDESALDAKSGSLWVMEGQGAYLFAQNPVRLIGDPLAVQLEGDPRDQLNSKVTVIKKLLAKIEERQKARLRGPAGEEKDADKEEESADAKKKDKNKKDTQTAGKQEPAQDSAGDIGIKNVPTRIVERTLEGNYRVKGSQPFMIGPREYKVIVTGIVRAEDFNDDGIPASKLLDPKFDIVSARQKVGEM